MSFQKLFFIGIVCCLPLIPVDAALPVHSFSKDVNGVTLTMQPGILRVEPVGESTFHVIYSSGDALPTNPLFAVEKQPAPGAFSVQENGDSLLIKTAHCAASINRTTGVLSFLDSTGKVFLQEHADDAKVLTPATLGSATNVFAVTQRFLLDPQEALYGLGQHPGGVMNWVGHTIHLQQKNSDIAVPVLVSSKGYGIFWNNPAVTDVRISNASDPSPVIEWKSAAGTGINYFVFYGPEISQVIADYRELTGSAPMFARWGWGFWQCKQRYHSQDQLLDTVERYRKMQVPIDGIIQDWLYWYPSPWGSHQFDPIRYPDPAAMMKQLHDEHAHLLISVWAKFDVGSDNWKTLNAAGALYPQVMSYAYPPGKGQWYDPFSPEGRRIYWNQMSQQIFSKGVDGWWLDASEAEISGNWGEFNDFMTAAGSGALVYNAYPLMHTTAVFQGQRKENPAKRVFILTRSSYAGQQRNASVAWSGDIQGTWDVYRQQIPNGINFSLSGIPYWNTDTGGFFGGSPSDPKYAELFTRWFQFSAFCPMFRVHGDATGDPVEPTKNDKPGKEMWQFAPETEKVLIDFDNLRYHLLPYIYSVAWRVTSKNDSMMRGLIMDFPNDPMVRNIPDQYLFGPSLMVCPVTQEGAASRKVYLPTGTSWTDFWTGETLQGGQSIDVTAPIQNLPLYLRAGSILPYGPKIQYATQSVDPMELRIVRGADGDFTLYEDEGDNYNYEKGIYATIPFHWNDKTGMLTIRARQGKFPGMLERRTFRIVWVSPGHGIGIDSTAKADVTVTYDGNEVAVKSPQH